MAGYTRRPPWLKLTPDDPAALNEMSRLMRGLNLHTVCESARCPNRTECFRHTTATFMILGDVCTRNCTFCAVASGSPQPPDPAEPGHIVAAIDRLKLRYAVITSVTRDDLPDGGASQFAAAINAVREHDPAIAVEVLIPDFQGSLSALKTVIDASPAVLNHNVETVPRLYPKVRPQADYRRSLALLERCKELDGTILTKSGLMVGLGETRDEITALMADLRRAGCDLLTIGQYLQPSRRHHEIMRFVTPEEFLEYEHIGKEMGFRRVFSGPLVRSSFHAAETYLAAKAR